MGGRLKEGFWNTIETELIYTNPISSGISLRKYLSLMKASGNILYLSDTI